MKKRVLSLALALVLCLGLLPALSGGAEAASATMTEIVSAETISGSDNGHWWDGTLHFSDGVAWVGNSGYWSAVDTTGKIVCGPFSYQYVGNFSDGVAWADRDHIKYAVDRTGRELFSTEEPFSVNSDSDVCFHDGLARLPGGYVDKTGKTVISSRQGGIFSEGLAMAYDPANAYYGYIDKTGKTVIPCQYASALEFADGIALVSLGSRWTVIDKTGKDLLPQEYSYHFTTSRNGITPQVVVAKGSDRNIAYITRDGKIVSGGYDVAQPFANGMSQVRKDGKYGYVNEAGVLAIPCQFESTQDFRDGYALVMTSGNGYSIIDKTGKVTGTVSSAANAGNGCFRIESNESGRRRIGFVDYTGREVVPCKYQAAMDFSGGVAAVQNFEGKWGFVDTSGTEVVPCQYYEIRYSNEPGIFAVHKSIALKDWCIMKSSGWTEPGTPAAPATPNTPSTPAGVTAAPTASKVLVNGKEVSFDAYNIGGANYFKLRDLAFVLSGTEKQFSVGWDNASKTISLTSGQGYTAVGGELAAGASGNQTATPSSAKLLINGKEVSLTAYTIGGSNYFKLRDIGQAFDFGIGWDNASKTITIDTSTGYTAG